MVKHALFAAGLAVASVYSAGPAWAQNGGTGCIARTSALLNVASPESLVQAVLQRPVNAEDHQFMIDIATGTLDAYRAQVLKVETATATRREIADFDRLIAEIGQVMPQQAAQMAAVRNGLAQRFEEEKVIAERARNTTQYVASLFCAYVGSVNGAQSAPPPMNPAPSPAPAWNGPAAGTPQPGGPEMTIMLEDAHQSVNIATGALSPGNHAPQATTHLQSGMSYSGSVSTGGILPPGYTIYVFFHSQIWAVLSPTGGSFTVGENRGFGAQNDVEAVACLAGARVGGPLPIDRNGQRGCLYNAVIDIIWRQ